MGKYQTASYMMLCKINDFASNFLIPAKFVKKYGEIGDHASVMLETDDSGKSWEVKIKRVDGDLYMKDGSWSEFVMDNDLTENDFLTFRWLHRSSSFKVSIYGENCCLKHPTSPTSSGTNVKKKRQSLPYMEIYLKSHHQSRVSLVKELRNAGGMRKNKYVVMEYAATRDRKRIELDHRRWRTDLAKGWPEFRKANGIEYGKTYSLEFNPKENVIHVQQVN